MNTSTQIFLIGAISLVGVIILSAMKVPIPSELYAGVTGVIGWLIPAPGQKIGGK